MYFCILLNIKIKTKSIFKLSSKETKKNVFLYFVKHKNQNQKL